MAQKYFTGLPINVQNRDCMKFISVQLIDYMSEKMATSVEYVTCNGLPDPHGNTGRGGKKTHFILGTKWKMDESGCESIQHLMTNAVKCCGVGHVTCNTSFNPWYCFHTHFCIRIDECIHSVRNVIFCWLEGA